jgi:hypothetical protein
MAGIFDLTSIKHLIKERHPSAAIIVDTGVIMSEPDFAKWKTSFENPLFVLPCIMGLELEHLKNKPDSRNEANTASKNIFEICRRGHIAEGIYREGIGWFVSTPLPSRESLITGLEQLNTLVKVLGQIDTELVILSKELMQGIADIPIIFATADINLYNTVQFIGINSFLFKGFPMNEITKENSLQPPKTVKWDNILEDIQIEAVRRRVQVELTLRSKSCAPKWINAGNENIPQSQIIVAEGTGMIHAVVDIRFSWSLPFIPWNFPGKNAVPADKSDEGSRNGPSAQTINKFRLETTHLDFGGLDPAVSPNLFNALVQKLNNCASPLAYIEDMPTVQDPASVTRQFFLFEFIFQERGFQNRLPPESVKEFENNLKTPANLLKWAYYWFYDRETTREEQKTSFSEFLHAMKSCWAIGDTVRVDLLTDPSGISNIKEKAEE